MAIALLESGDVSALATSLALFCVAAAALYGKGDKNGKAEERERLVQDYLASQETKVFKCLGAQDPSHQALYTAVDTQQLIREKKLSATDNVVLLAKRCRTHGCDRRRSNALADELYDEALRTARELNIDSTDREKPLLGVPISIKESLSVKGAAATAGVIWRLKHPCTEDSLMVRLLRNAGAVIMCTGNVPQLLMMPECNNNIWGRARNPWNLKRTPGGSSGGDAALVAMRCVPLAIGTDVAGSLRGPASFCGIVGFKPTSLRLTKKGAVRAKKGNKSGTDIAIPMTAGPLARTVDDCALFMKAVCVPEMFVGDLNTPPMPFDDKAYNAKGPFRIGYFKTNHFVEPCPTAMRAMNETIAALEKAGHTLVPFEAPTTGWDATDLLIGVKAAEGRIRSYMDALDGEQLVNEYRTVRKAATLPNWIRAMLVKTLEKRPAFLLGRTTSTGLHATEVFQATSNILEFRNKWADAFASAEVDALLFPSMPIPAFPHGMCEKLSLTVSYLFVASLLMWPSGSVPVTTVRSDEQRYYPKEELPADQRDGSVDLIEQVMHDSAGMPVGLSVMAPAYRDETCLRIMKEVEKVSNFRKQPVAFKEP